MDVTKRRKKWSLHDGPKGTLQLLRNQLAADGCPDSQLALAKQLLEAEEEGGKGEKSSDNTSQNDQMAIYWLIKSAEQGNTEANDLLGRCLASGRGITQHNYGDVRACHDMPAEEKRARQAARDMFASLSNGHDYVTWQQLRCHMQDLYCINASQPRATGGDDDDADDDVVMAETRQLPPTHPNADQLMISEAQLVSAATAVCHGHAPSLPPLLLPLPHHPPLLRPIMAPRLSLRLTLVRLVQRLALLEAFCLKSGRRLLVALSLQLLLLLFWRDLGVLAFSLALAAMLCTTAGILQRVWLERAEIAVWQRFLRCCDGETTAEIPVWRGFSVFFAFWLAALASLPDRMEGAWPGAVCAMAALGCLATTANPLNYVNFALLLVAKYSLLPTAALVPLPLICYAIQRRSGTHSALLPHLVSLLWLQVALECLKRTTPPLALKALLALGAALFMPQLASLAAILLPAAILAGMLSQGEGLKPLLLWAGLSLSGLMGVYAIARKSVRAAQVVLVGVAVLGVGVALGQMLQHAGGIDIKQPNPRLLTWPRFAALCHQHPSSPSLPLAPHPTACHRLIGLPVRWAGRVAGWPRPHHVHNRLAALLEHWLPEWLLDVVYCQLGAEYQCSGDEEEKKEGYDAGGGVECLLKEGNGRRCHLDMYTHYTARTLVTMRSSLFGRSHTIHLLASSNSAPTLANFTLSLRPDDEIEFQGQLRLYADDLAVDLVWLRCLQCHDPHLKSTQQPATADGGQSLLELLQSRCKFVLNSITSPVWVFE